MSVSDRLGVLLDPRFWNRTDRVDHDWDASLSILLRASEEDILPVIIGSHTATIGKIDIWTSNFPYSYGNQHPRQGLPKRKTALRLRRVIQQAVSRDLKVRIEKAIADATGNKNQ